jgi:hypothetical protein
MHTDCTFQVESVQPCFFCADGHYRHLALAGRESLAPDAARVTPPTIFWAAAACNAEE